MSVKVHDFETSLRLSESHADAPWWEQVYRQAFPAFASMTCIRADGWAQRGGIDRIIQLRDGTAIKVDEKVRTKAWPDFLLEYWSAFYGPKHPRNTRGWVAKDLTCDFIAYAFIPTATCYLLPFQALRRAWRENCQTWRPEYQRVVAQNRDYQTHSLAVPIDVVLHAIVDALIVRWEAADHAAR